MNVSHAQGLGGIKERSEAKVIPRLHRWQEATKRRQRASRTAPHAQGHERRPPTASSDGMHWTEGNSVARSRLFHF